MINNKSFLFSIILYFSLTITTSVILVSAQDQQCLAKGSFNTNSTFNKNRLLLLSSLPSNVTSQNNFFYNSSLGQDRDRIYALAMCIPDTETEDCSNCVKTTSDGLIKTCPNSTEAFHWSGGEKTLCFVRYSTRSFIGSPDMDPRQILPNATDIRSNLTDFDGIWQDLMLRMVESASSKYYEAETTPLTSTSSRDTMTIYTIMQCTSDVSNAECNTCLRNSVGDYQNCCRGKQGGLVTRPNCIFRWEFYPFYGAFRNTSPPAKKDGSSTVKIVVPVLVVGSLLFLAVVGYVLYRRRKKNNKDSLREAYQELDTAEVEALSSLKFEFRVIQAATSDFSEESKLGEGGFGPVYKGKLQNGEEIAVKRLALSSGQGEEEFKNEVLLLSKLQHRNLVKLLGFCLKGEERLLIYEFVPNSSLDHFIFEVAKQDHTLSLKASWSTRYSIIENIARGILYLHEDSRLKIIHRDLKPSNILLDYQMNPKISDFGMARLFESDDHTQGLTTSRVMGTYGYMAPEYIAQGRLSVKTDVYSYGIMVLEIICGRKNNSFQPSGVALHAWTNWRGDRALDIVDSAITENVSRNEMMKCINIGLLCVQESVTRRPNMNSVVHWLKSNSVTLPVPSTPAYVVHSESGEASRVSQSTVNVSITELEPLTTKPEKTLGLIRQVHDQGSVNIRRNGIVFGRSEMAYSDNRSNSNSSLFLANRRRPKRKNQSIVPMARLFGPAIFESSKLKVLFLGVDEKKHPLTLPRTYTLTHSDITAKLTLAISNSINNSQLQGWANRLYRDEVVAEWKKVKGNMSLHVHCHISGGHFLLDLFAKFRYYIFCKELPVVLKAFVHGDVNLLNHHPELQEALVYVYFHSNVNEFNRVECWGPLWEATSPDGHRTQTLPEKQCVDECSCCFPPVSSIPWSHSLSNEGVDSYSGTQGEGMSTPSPEKLY
ncbi:unnamed protein product [Brassica rapa]|uniref:Protein kinase domain-containing protein n=1 Tax=Brassica campestris TaxID=3711 RepID=A0A8D9LUI5_BRACM|nr:unnamed protein product [Brassica rapa]